MNVRHCSSVVKNRARQALLLFVPLLAVVPTSCKDSAKESSSPADHLPPSISAFYTEDGLRTDSDKYIDDLVRADASNIGSTLDAMKLEWDQLRPEVMYVAARRLFGLGLKDEAVYWFYSAQYRAQLFQSLCWVGNGDRVGGNIGDIGLLHGAFQQLLSAPINGHAMDNPKATAEIVARVLAEGKAIPDCRHLYPDVVFDPRTKWSEVQQEVSGGLSELLEMLEEHAAAYPDGMPEDAAGDARGRADTRRTWPDPQVAALATAAQDGRVAEIDRLVAAGVDVNAKGFGRTTPLYWALRHFNKTGYSRLLEHGASPNVETADGDSVMHFAAGWIEPEWFELALQHGGDPNLPRSRDRRAPNRTPIFDSLDGGRTEHLQLLINAGADVNRKDHEGQTPLEYAIRRGKYESAYQLLEAGADYRVKSSQGKDMVAVIRESVRRHGHETVWPGKVLEFVQRP